jgi:hypothetical protein
MLFFNVNLNLNVNIDRFNEHQGNCNGQHQKIPTKKYSKSYSKDRNKQNVIN